MKETITVTTTTLVRYEPDESWGAWTGDLSPRGCTVEGYEHKYVHKFSENGEIKSRQTTDKDLGDSWLLNFSGEVIYNNKTRELPEKRHTYVLVRID